MPHVDADLAMKQAQRVPVRPVLPVMALSATAAVLSACMEGQALDPASAAQFLAQATMGYTWEEVLQLGDSTIDQWLASQFDMPRDGTHFDWLLGWSNALLAKGDDLTAQADALQPQIDALQQQVAAGQASQAELDALKAQQAKLRSQAELSTVRTVTDETMAYNSLWRRLITGKDQLRQRMVLALSEILVVSGDGLGVPYLPPFYLAGYLDVLEAHAFGNYRGLLEAITLNPAMGYYLGTKGNSKADARTGRLPDENYAREIMQLFSIGLLELNEDGSARQQNGQDIESYSQEDILNLSRVFTGWDVKNRTTLAPSDAQRAPMTHFAERHSSEAKNFLGTHIPAGTPGPESLKAALDALFNHPNVGPFIGRQLIQRLVSSNPTPAYVQRVAKVFANNGQGVRGDLKAVLRAILIDSEARSPLLETNSSGKLREPVLRFTQWARAFKATSPSGRWEGMVLHDAALSLGQQPLKSPSVFNFFRPGYVPPNTEIAKAGLRAPEFQIVTETSVVGYVNFMHKVIVNGLSDLKPDYSAWLPMARKPDELAATFNALFAGGRLSFEQEAQLVEALQSIPADDDAGRLKRVQAACLLVMASPAYLIQQ